MLTLQQAITLRGLKDPKVKPYKVFTATLSNVQAEGKKRRFPQLAGQSQWYDKKDSQIMCIKSNDDGSIDIDYPCNVEFSALQVAEYVRKYCELNSLKI